MIDPADLITIVFLLVVVITLLLMPPGPGTPLRMPTR
jgi:hypothetical protein